MIYTCQRPHDLWFFSPVQISFFSFLCDHSFIMCLIYRTDTFTKTVHCRCLWESHLRLEKRKRVFFSPLTEIQIMAEFLRKVSVVILHKLFRLIDLLVTCKDLKSTRREKKSWQMNNVKEYI